MSKNTRNRILLTALAALLLVTLTIGGTMAWLTATTTEVTNTFTAANIEATLTESNTPWTMQLVPGTSKDKNPTVTVTTSVDAYVFIKFDTTVAENSDTLNYDFLLNNGADEYGYTWTQGTGADGNGVPTNVWYTIVDDSTTPYEWSLLVGETVSVPTTADKDDVSTGFTMTFDVWAIQAANGDDSQFTAKQAWDQVSAITD